jgi:two-component system, LytTR family, sensor kinase
VYQARFAEETDRGARHFPSGRELAGIVAFWTVFAALSTTNWLFPPGGQAPPITLRAVTAGLLDAIIWAALTPPIFWFTSRYSVEREARSSRIATYVLVSIVVALGADVLVELVRMHFIDPLRVGSGFSGPPRSPWGFARIRFVNDLMVVFAIFAGGVARDYFARYNRRLEEAAVLRAQLAEARLTVLQSQLNPHFLFNTLNAVSTLVESDPRGVRRMIARLSELLRATLEPSSEPEIPLSRELAFIERYLEILRIRFQGRLETSIVAAPGTADALVPPLVLQPIVENAMKHAISKTTQASRIDVRADRSGARLVLSVTDTGSGENSMRAAGAPSMGIGLRNTRARLEQLYSHGHELRLDRTDSGGTVVTIQLPYHTAK